ncbi:MAG: hypothetical protein ACE5RP_00040 [Nitrosopumilus sp.]
MEQDVETNEAEYTDEEIKNIIEAIIKRDFNINNWKIYDHYDGKNIEYDTLVNNLSEIPGKKWIEISSELVKSLKGRLESSKMEIQSHIGSLLKIIEKNTNSLIELKENNDYLIELNDSNEEKIKELNKKISELEEWKRDQENIMLKEQIKGMELAMEKMSKNIVELINTKLPKKQEKESSDRNEKPEQRKY